MIKKLVFVCLCTSALHGAEHGLGLIQSASPRPENRSREQRALTKKIADTFRANNTLQEDEIFSGEAFSDLLQQATRSRNPFFLAVIQAGPNNYHFFDAPGLARYFQTSNKFENPNNRQLVRQIFIYRYNGKRSQFPFEYVQTTGDRYDFIAGGYRFVEEPRIKQEREIKMEHSYIVSDTRRPLRPRRPSRGGMEYSYLVSDTRRPSPRRRLPRSDDIQGYLEVGGNIAR